MNAPLRCERLSAAFPQRILVVDDNVDSAVTLALMLKAMGHESAVSHDGASAIETAKAFKPTLVLWTSGCRR